MSEPKLRASLTPHPLFKAHPEVWETLAPSVQSKHIEKDEVIFHHSDPASHLWLVNHGWVKLTRQTPDGKETVIGLCTDGDVFGKSSLFPSADYPYTAEAISATEAFAIPAEAVRSVLRIDAELSAHIMALLSERVAQAQLKLEQMSTMSAPQRLGCFLLRLCHLHTGEKHLQIPVEKHVLAAFLGMKPETLSRSQQQLNPIGITICGNNIAIENVDRLRAFVCNSCSQSGNCETEI